MGDELLYPEVIPDGWDAQEANLDQREEVCGHPVTQDSLAGGWGREMRRGNKKKGVCQQEETTMTTCLHTCQGKMVRSRREGAVRK